jgi:hypothetical protein
MLVLFLPCDQPFPLLPLFHCFTSFSPFKTCFRNFDFRCFQLSSFFFFGSSCNLSQYIFKNYTYFENNVTRYPCINWKFKFRTSQHEWRHKQRARNYDPEWRLLAAPSSSGFTAFVAITSFHCLLFLLVTQDAQLTWVAESFFIYLFIFISIPSFLPSVCLSVFLSFSCNLFKLNSYTTFQLTARSLRKAKATLGPTFHIQNIFKHL